MISLYKLRVTSLDLDFHEVTWAVMPTTEDVLDYDFSVLRSEAEEGPYEAISGKFLDRYDFVDTILLTQHRWRRYHYKIRVDKRGTDEFKEFGPCSIDPAPDLVAMEVRRHIRLLMHEFAGRRCVVLPVRTFGPRCSCWDDTLGKRLRSGCRDCFDTSFVRGYMHPVESWIQVDPSSKSQQQVNLAETQQDNTTMRLGYYPSVKPNDLIIEPENKRWRVIKQNQTEHSRAAVHQELVVQAINPPDIEFKIPVEFSEALPNLFFTPRRNFSNPHNLENFGNEYMAEIFGMYAR